MLRTNKLFILIPMLVLIPLLLAATPLKLVSKMKNSTPLSQCQGKLGFCYKKCLSHSLVSQNHFDTAATDAKSSGPAVLSFQDPSNAAPESFHSCIHINFTPLRC